MHRKETEKRKENEMTVELDQGVAYVQFEKKLNIRFLMQYFTTSLLYYWMAFLAFSWLRGHIESLFLSPSTFHKVKRNMMRQIFRVLSTHPGCGSTCPMPFPGANASQAGTTRWGGGEVSLNQVITKSCSFEKEEARAQEFVLNPWQVSPFTSSLQYNQCPIVDRTAKWSSASN